MKKFRVRVFAALALALCCGVAVLLPFIVQASNIIDDQFADGISTNQNLPGNSLSVLKSRSGTTRTDAVGSVEYNMIGTGTSAEGFFAYFTNSGSPITLSVGDSLTFAGTFSVTGFNPAGNDIRFGVLNSNGSRRITDLTGGNSATEFGDDTGYALQFNSASAGSNPFVLYRRDVVSPTPITNIFNSFSSAGFTAIPGSGATTRQLFADATPYTLTYTITRQSATQTQITASVAGGAFAGQTYTATETSATPYTAFDWFDFRVAGTNFAQKVKFTRLKVDYTPAAPVINVQPAPISQTVPAGGNTSYTVGVTGIQLTYEWRKDNVAVTGNPSAATATLLLNNVLPADAGVYTVFVSNPGGDVTSDPVTLIVSSGPVDPPPVIDTQPVDTTAVVGTPASLSVGASGLNLMYQWFKDGNIMGGQTSSTLSFGSAQASDAAVYTVKVSNGGGIVPSDPARLTVVSTMAPTALQPANTATGICVDTPLSITFDQTPKLGTTGRVRLYTSTGTLIDTIDMAASPQTKTIGGTSFRYFPIIINGNTASIYPHVQLAYNQAYYVTMETGVLTDLTNLPYIGFAGTGTFGFTTRTAAPAAGSSVLTVNGNGTGDFCTIQGAVDFVPAANAQRVIVNVKNGTYTEIVNVPANKPQITVKGESRAGTIQKYPNNNNLNPSTTTRPSFNVNTGANDFNLENITLQNSTPQGGSQAEAFRSYSLRTTVNSVNLLSYQDTLLTQGTAYVTNSYIEGDVDFMWGTGSTYFNNTEIKELREGLGYYTQIRNAPASFGNVYFNCRLTRGPGVTNGIYLGRIDPDDFPGSQVVLINSQMDTHVIPVSWRFDNPSFTVDATNYPTIRYWEAGSTALDGITPIDCSLRHPISRNACNNPLTQTEIDFYSNPFNIINFNPPTKLTAAVTLSNLSQLYDGTPKAVSVNVDPSGLTVDVTYNGSPIVPTNAGTYAVVATVNDPNYQGSANGNLTIGAAAATVSLSDLTQTYDGSPKPATVITNPFGISTAVTYNGSATVPTAIGNYTVSAVINDPNYTGSAVGNLNIRSTVKAFPGAEGTGAYSIGGRGGDVYHVTNLNDLGPGSLRGGIQTATGPRTIVFDVAGTIYLDSRLMIDKSFITIAGQTAPADGITIAGWTSMVNNAQHVIIRYMRFRPGDIRCANGMEGDSLWVDNSKDVIIDHVSASWSIDESLSVTDSDRVSVQWSFITESLNTSCHPEGRHGYGSLIRYGDGKISYHHNLYAHHFNRNPRVGDNITLDFVNNVIFDWGTDASYSGPLGEGITKVNYVGNYLVAGPNTPAGKRSRAFNGGSVDTWIYQTGNLIDGNVNGVHDGVDTGWAMFVNLYTQQGSPLKSTGKSPEALPDITIDTAQTAYARVTSGAGDSQYRDPVDTRIMSEVQNESGLFINSQNDVGGFPVLNSQPAPVDTDGDGMPDNWETSHGLNPNDPNDGPVVTGNGYTNLENYLNRSLLAPTAANVTLGGRVHSVSGLGIFGVRVTLTDSAGMSRSVMTNPFGYYGFNDITAGQSYILTVSNKRVTFSNPTRVVTVNDNLSDEDFVSDN